MSEDKQGKTKRPASSREATEPVAPVEAKPTPAVEAAEALPAPEQLATLPAPVPETQRATDRYFAAYRATLASIGESQAAIASDMTAFALEMSGFARSNLTAAGDSVTAMLTARSLVDAVEVQLGFARRSLDALADGSTRLGEIGLRLANDAAKPMARSLAAG